MPQGAVRLRAEPFTTQHKSYIKWSHFKCIRSLLHMAMESSLVHVHSQQNTSHLPQFSKRFEHSLGLGMLTNQTLRQVSFTFNESYHSFPWPERYQGSSCFPQTIHNLLLQPHFSFLFSTVSYALDFTQFLLLPKDWHIEEVPVYTLRISQLGQL